MNRDLRTVCAALAGDLDLPTLEELQMAALRKAKAERYERYASLPLALIDSTTASQRQARQIVIRAVEAMGGVAALAAGSGSGGTARGMLRAARG